MNIEAELPTACDDTSIHDILPPELFDDIFEALRHIDDGKDALFVSSLVSRTWRTLTLRHRFHSLSFYMVRTFRSQQPPNNQLLEFLDSDAFPRVGRCVRCLSLRWRGIRIDSGFARFVNHFPSLYSLELKGHISSPVDLSVQHEPIGPNIRMLTIHGQLPLAGGRSRRHFSSSLCDILCQFRSLDELRLLYIGGASREGDCNTHNRTLPEINSLVLRCIGFEDPIAGVVKQLAGRRPLKRLDLLEYTGEDLQETLDVVKCFDATPEHIRFSLTCWGKEMNVDLSSLRALKRLTIAIEINPREASADALRIGCSTDNSVPWIEATQSLTTLDPHCHLESIDIYIGPAEIDADGLFLPRMMDTLSELRPGAVRAFEDVVLQLAADERLGHVAVSLYREIPTEIGLDPRFFCPAGEYLRTVFPRLEQSGVLRV